jgi:hypothetical protein
MVRLAIAGTESKTSNHQPKEETDEKFGNLDRNMDGLLSLYRFRMWNSDFHL